MGLGAVKLWDSKTPLIRDTYKANSSLHVTFLRIAACCLFSIDVLYISKRGTADGCILEKQVNHGCNHFLYCNQCLDELRSASFAQHSRQTSRACSAATLKKKKKEQDFIELYTCVLNPVWVQIISWKAFVTLTWAPCQSFSGRNWGGSWRALWLSGLPPFQRPLFRRPWKNHCGPSPWFHMTSQSWKHLRKKRPKELNYLF